MSISELHRPGDMAADRAIVDLLELQELDLVPGILTTARLRRLWHCSQSQVSRRLAAIDRLGTWRLQSAPGPGGAYWLAPRLKPAPPLPTPRPPRPRYRPSTAAAQRWEQVRQRWGAVA